MIDGLYQQVLIEQPRDLLLMRISGSLLDFIFGFEGNEGFFVV
jgi:hypothetical protein